MLTHVIFYHYKWENHLIDQENFHVMIILRILEIFFIGWLAQLVERQSAEREVEGSSPRPDQHSGS